MTKAGALRSGLFRLLWAAQNEKLALKRMTRAAELWEKIPPARLLDLPNCRPGP
jgi:hypothetical protein